MENSVAEAVLDAFPDDADADRIILTGYGRKRVGSPDAVLINCTVRPGLDRKSEIEVGL